ncbi:hypothetical protein BH160DRAFT_3855 [Burkholderia sp. H160]|nr:hypothetical protein BH160DRAFT_3855 [Burkholderia sp. H160]
MPSPISFPVDNASPKNPRVAVLLYGMVRDYEKCASSIERVLLGPNNADLFYFGPSFTDYPDREFSIGERDSEGFIIKNPKTDAPKFFDVDADAFERVYKKNIRAYKFHDTPPSFFETEAGRLVTRDKWLFGLPPSRILSMFYNFDGVVREFNKYRAEHPGGYDAVVITRPDLVLYNSISAEIKDGTVHIPSGEGFDEMGRNHLGNAPVFYYKNINTGEYVPGGREVGFNDQIIILPVDVLESLSDIYKEAKEMIGRGVPSSPETIIYLMLKNRDIKIEAHPEWAYEIYRRGGNDVANVLTSPELKVIDRYHPSLTKNDELLVRASGISPSPEFAEHFRGTSIASNLDRANSDRARMNELNKSNSSTPEIRLCEIGLQFDQLPASFKGLLRLYSIFLNERLTNKLKNKPAQFFADARNPISIFFGRFYLALSVTPGARVYNVESDR